MPAILMLHSIWRWVVLLAAAAAIIKALVGWFRRQPWTEWDDRLGMLYTLAIDIQVLLGVILYIVEQRWRLPDPFFAYIHPAIMIAALVLAHIGRSRTRKAAPASGTEGAPSYDMRRHRTAATFYAVSFLLIVAAIPWNRTFR